MNEGVKYIQTVLKAEGFDPGPIDGKWGPNTKAAFDEMVEGRVSVPLDMSPHLPLFPQIATEVSKQPKAARPIEGIVIHCTATPEGRYHTVADVRKWHMNSPTFWSDIGYHYLVKLDGEVETGRPEARVGAHVVEANNGTLGVVYVGGVNASLMPKDTRTPAQKTALIELCKALIKKYPTIKWIKGHNDFTNAKACPSFKVGNDPLGRLI